MATNEKTMEAVHEKVEHVDDVDYVEKRHVDGTIDMVDKRAIGGDVEDLPEGYFRSPQFIGTVVATCTASICAYLGWVLPANTLLLINADIGPSLNINWVATAWTLGSGIGFLLVGRLSDIFGRKWMVIGCNILSLIGCIIGATAQSIGALIGSNLLNGIAAAGQLSFGIVLGELVPNKMRGPLITLVFFSSMPFAVFGPTIARLFIMNTAAGWRWSYYLGIIFAGITLILYVLFYHPPRYDQLHVHGKTQMQQIKELDFGGLFLFFGGMVLFLVGLSWGGTTYPWVSGYVLGTLIAGIFTLVAFVLYEQYVVKGHGIMPPRIFKNIGYVSLVGIAGVAAMVYYSMTVLWPTIIGTVYTADSLKIGMQSSVIGGGTLLGQIFGGFAISYIPKVKFQVITMAIISTSFVGALASLSPLNHAMFIAFGVVGTVAIGWIDNITFPGVTLLFEAQDIGLATGALGSIRAMCGAIAQALYVSILNTEMAKNLPANVTPAATNAGLPASSLEALFAAITTGDFTTVPGITPEITALVGQAVTKSYVSAFKVVFLATIPFGALLIFFAVICPNFEKYLQGNVARRLQGSKKPAKSVEKA